MVTMLEGRLITIPQLPPLRPPVGWKPKKMSRPPEVPTYENEEGLMLQIGDLEQTGEGRTRRIGVTGFVGWPEFDDVAPAVLSLLGERGFEVTTMQLPRREGQPLRLPNGQLAPSAMNYVNIVLVIHSADEPMPSHAESMEALRAYHDEHHPPRYLEDLGDGDALHVTAPAPPGWRRRVSVTGILYESPVFRVLVGERVERGVLCRVMSVSRIDRRPVQESDGLMAVETFERGRYANPRIRVHQGSNIRLAFVTYELPGVEPGELVPRDTDKRPTFISKRRGHG